MATIATGGGPSLGQRRDFAGLKDGTQVPGYRGYCPQLKYKVGKTYGRDTNELSKEFDHHHPPGPVAPGFSTKPPIINNLPKSTGNNKYTETMVPGYTGYIPRWPFKFGGTYKNDCDICIDEHMSNTGTYQDKEKSLLNSMKSFPQLQAINRDPEVRDHLNTYRDTHPKRPTLMDDKRTWTEPPIPGYQGYIPRIGTTELGLGGRYHVTTGRGLGAFSAEREHHEACSKEPINLSMQPEGVKEVGNLYGKRLYLNDGMIPRYTGYLPQRRFRFGQTYGDTTRTLEVCAHPKESYGDFVQSQPRKMHSSLA